MTAFNAADEGSDEAFEGVHEEAFQRAPVWLYVFVPAGPIVFRFATKTRLETSERFWACRMTDTEFYTGQLKQIILGVRVRLASSVRDKDFVDTLGRLHNIFIWLDGAERMLEALKEVEGHEV